jgi:formylglycine-generating enzyme required for sulfatase activity
MTFAMLLTSIFSPCQLLAVDHNPQPAEGDLVLPMPGGTSMVFRPVYIGEGSAPFASRRFKVGDPSSGFKEFPTAVVIGGAFLGQRGGQPDWLYYMGKYEVTEAQYYSVVEPPAADAVGLRSSQLPVTNISWHEVGDFISKYNQWLFANATDKLPKVDGSVSYVRLPTETEWEFAARGGAEVSPDEFDRRHPYPSNVVEYEWFAGPKSSHNKVMKVGLLKPNPLKLHDMLGNVSEMTHCLYQIEYYQGRTGGFVCRGGHFFTSESELRSSLRTEQPLYVKDSKTGLIQPNRKSIMGLRLVISSIIYPNQESAQQLAAAWESYRGSRGALLPAGVSVGPVSAKSDVYREDAFVSLGRLKDSLSQTGITSSTVQEEFGRLEASLGQIQFIRKQAEEDSAYAWAKIAAEQAFFIFRELRKLPALEQLATIAEKTNRSAMVEKYQERKTELLENIEQALTTYSDSLRQLAGIPPTVVNDGFDKYRKFLMERNAAEQVRILTKVGQHFAAFSKEQRADRERWRADFGTPVP